MDEMPLKPKGSKPSSKKGKAKKGKEGQTPNSGKKKATFAETVGKEVVEEKDIEYKLVWWALPFEWKEPRTQKGDSTRS